MNVFSDVIAFRRNYKRLKTQKLCIVDFYQIKFIWMIEFFSLGNARQAASKLILLTSKTIHSDNYQIIQILCDAKWRG